MFENLMERFLRKFKYVRVLESDRDYLYEQVERYGEKLQLVNKAMAKEQLEKERVMAIMKIMIDKPMMVFGNNRDGRYITVSESDIQKYKQVGIEVSSMFPQNAVKIEIRKGFMI